MDELNVHIKFIEERIDTLSDQSDKIVSETGFLLYSLKVLCDLRTNVLSGKSELQSKG